jgi:uncharacterized protein (DUF433 family)/DNA-binding transcriptional MerR regulator
VPRQQIAELESLLRGVYRADRAAALAGVPRSTLYYWARRDVWSPTRRETRPKLWTYTDILAARIIYWLRQEKPEIESARTSMPQVREALTAIRARGSELWEAHRPESQEEPALRVFVDRDGRVYFKDAAELRRAGRPWTSVIPGALDVLGEFRGGDRLGPDLIKPRQHLRIIPGKLGGEPHVQGTRIGTRAVAALIRDGLTVDQVKSLYPDLVKVAIDECWDLEKQLQPDLVRAA